MGFSEISKFIFIVFNWIIYFFHHKSKEYQISSKKILIDQTTLVLKLTIKEIFYDNLKNENFTDLTFKIQYNLPNDFCSKKMYCFRTKQHLLIVMSIYGIYIIGQQIIPIGWRRIV